MIEISNPIAIDSGDITQVDTTNLKNNALFADPVNGLGIFRKATNDWLFITGNGVAMIEVNKTNADLQDDGFQTYLELQVDAVFSCELNGKSQNGQLDKTYPITRYYGNFLDKTTPQSIKLYVKL